MGNFCQKFLSLFGTFANQKIFQDPFFYRARYRYALQIEGSEN